MTNRSFLTAIRTDMKRFPFVCALIISGLLLAGANGCSSDPNVEGAKLDLRNQDYDRALENVNTALASNPDNAEALELKGRILQEMASGATNVQERSELVQEMMESYERARQVDPEMATLIDQRLRLAWVNEFQEGIEAFNRGQTDQQAYLEAAQYFENSTRIAPDSTGGYVNQAYALINADRVEEALEPLQQAIDHGDTSPEIYIRLASLYTGTNRPDEAVEVLRAARDVHPTDTDIQSQLLNAYVQADRMDEAMQDYVRLVEAEPNNKYYRYNYGSLLLEAEQYEDAIAQLREAVRIDPFYPAAQFNLGASFINRAVDLRDRINEMDDQLRSQRSSLSQDEISRREQEIERMVTEQRELFSEAIEPLEVALDLSTGARFEVMGDPGVRFTGELSGNAVREGGNVSRSVDGSVPDEFYVGQGNVSGTFRKLDDFGDLTVSLVVGMNEIASATAAEGEDSVSLSENVGNVGFEGANASSICQALFSAYIQTNQQDRAEVVSECAGYDEMQ